MRVSDLCPLLSARVLCGEPDKSVSGVYAGDLLSRAMSRVGAGSAWITIMANINVVAVAELADPAVVVLAEDVILQPDALRAAKENDLCVISTPLSVFEICCAIGRATEGREA